MNIQSMLLISIKDIRLLFSDKAAVFFTLFFPLIMATFFGTVFSGGGGSAGISLAIADKDNSTLSQAYIESLSESSALNVQRLDEATAKEQVRKGKITAVLIIPEGFEKSKQSLFDNDVPTIELGIDPSRKASASMLKGLLMAQAAEDMQKQFTDTSLMIDEVNKGLESIEVEQFDDPELQTMLSSVKTWMEKSQQQANVQEEDAGVVDDSNAESGDAEENSFSGFTPLTIEDKEIQRNKTGPQNAYAISFPQGMVWGIIGAITTYSLALISEVNSGTLGRLSSAPISRMTILGGKALACFMTIVFVCLVLVMVAMLFFKVSIYSWPILLTSILSCAFGFSGMMMLLSVLGKTEKAASGISWAILMLLAMTGGGMIPLIFMPKWMASVGELSPIKWAVVSFEGSFWRQYSFVDLLPTTGLLLTLGVVCFLIGSYIFNRREIN